MQATVIRYWIALLALVASLSIATLLMLGQDSDLSATTANKVCQDKNSSCLTYAGTSWNRVANSKALGGTYRVSSTKTNAAFFFAASGPSIDLVTIKGPKMGSAKVLVVDLVTGDVIKQVTYDLKASRTSYKVVKTITGLGPDRPYGVAITSANGRRVVVDAVKYVEAPPGLPPHETADSTIAPPPPGSGGCEGTYDGDQPPPPPPGDGTLPPPPPEC